MALLLALLTAGCDGGDQFDPGTLPGGGSNPGTGGGGGGTDDGALGNAALVGAWQNITLLDVGVGTQRVTTTWAFEANGACLRTRATLNPGVTDPVLETLTGACVATATRLDVTPVGSSVALTFTIGFLDLDRNTLLIDGVQFARQPSVGG